MSELQEEAIAPILIAVAFGVTALIVIIFAILYWKNPKFKGAMKGFTAPKLQESRWAVRRMSDAEYGALMGGISSFIASRGYIPTGQQPGFYAYQKQESPSIIVALILLLFCFIPGIIYLFVGGGTKVITIRAIDEGTSYRFIIQAPGGIKRNIEGMITPYQYEVIPQDQ